MKDVAAAINTMTDTDLKTLEQTNALQLGHFDLQLSDVEIITEDIPGWLVASEGGLTVALDVNVTDELRREGIARDFVNRIQNLRKDRDFDVTDKIRIELERNNEILVEAIEANKSYIQQEVQAVSLDVVSDLNGRSGAPSATEIEMDEFLLRVNVEVAR
jgi:isoleucyl-tRNA synthetase